MTTSSNSFTVRIADWQHDKASLMQVRRTVFVQEQQVPEELETDDYDNKSWYVLAESLEHLPIACARLQPNGKVTRIAVLKNWRRQGVARAMLQQLLLLAEQNNLSSLYLHAQLSAISLYKEFNFIEAGKEFEEAGIQHIKMTWQAH